jgi:hypothetical protein
VGGGGTGGWRKLLHDQVRNFPSSPDKNFIKFRKIKLVGQVAGMVNTLLSLESYSRDRPKINP